MLRKEPTTSELAKSIRDEFKNWQRYKTKGGTDPFHPDGTNMNLIRNHIFYHQTKLKELCKKEKMRPCPMESRMKPPRAVSEQYMAPGSKAAKHYIGPPLRRRSARTVSRKI